MLSSGTDHLRIPRGVEDNLHFRRNLLEDAGKSRHVRYALKRICSEDLLFWVNAFVFQYNPQQLAGTQVGPFATWDFQDEAFLEILRCVEERRDLVIVKSREMGASWMCLLAFLWLWLVKPRTALLVISRSAEAVDDPGNPNSLFWKLDFVLDHLPDWLKPEGWERRKHRTKMSFVNPENGSTIAGEASTGRAGVGGRATAMFVDEFSQIREDNEVLQRTADTTGCRVFNFTHTGLDTAAFRLSERPDVRKLTLHWSQHPEKNPGLYRYDPDSNEPGKIVRYDPHHAYPPDFHFDRSGLPGGPFAGLRSPWYDAECVRRDDKRAVAMDLDIDPRGSTHQFFDPVKVHALKLSYARDPVWEGDLDHDRDLARPRDGLVARAGGKLRLWVTPDHRGRLPADRYALGVDNAAGVGRTPSCVCLLNARTGEQVGEYADAFVEPADLAPWAVALAWLLKAADGDPAFLAWEALGPGLKFGARVVELGFRNVYWRTNDAKVVKQPTDTPGWFPSPQNQRLLLEDGRAALYSRRLVLHSELCLDETMDFKYTTQGGVKHGKSEASDDPSAARENHGDRVVAAFLAWKVAVASGFVRHLSTGQPAPEPEVTEAHPGTLAGRRLWAAELKRRETSWL